MGPTTTTALIRRFPGFALGYGGGKRAEQKFQPSKICQQYMNKQFDEVYKWTNGCLNGLVYRWTDGWTDG